MYHIVTERDYWGSLNQLESIVAYTLKLTTVGNSTGAIFPKEVLERLRVSKGDTLHLIETPGGLSIQPYDETFAKQMEVAERVMRENRDVLRKLAE